MQMKRKRVLLEACVENFVEQVVVVLCLLFPPYSDSASEDLLKSRDCKTGFGDIDLSTRLGARYRKGL